MIVAGAVEGLEDPLQVLPADAWPAVLDAQEHVLADEPTANRDRLCAGEARGVLEDVRQRLAPAAQHLRATEGDQVELDVKRPQASRDRVDRACTNSSIEHQSARGSAPPACRRDRAGFCTNRSKRALSAITTEASSRRCSSESVRDWRPPAAVAMAVSGERRSCETERSNVVLTTFARRSVSVSIS